jgi:hypothetical protein
MNELILIPCSGSKNPGGKKSVPGRKVTDQLNEMNSQELYRLRQQVAISFNINLKNGKNPDSELLKPAFNRYSGNLYLDKRDDIDLVIVSALYGLIYWDEPIINYNVAMSDTVKPRCKLYNWWKQNRLECILATFLKNKKYNIVRSFLSGDYKKAIPQIESEIDGHWLQYEYPGLGSGGNYYRGKDVANVLNDIQTNCPECSSRHTRRISRNEYICESCNSIYGAP